MEKQHEVEANSPKEHEVASESTIPPIELNLTKEQKAEIAREAQEKGIKETAKAYGIPWVKVRAWIGTYCRKPKGERLMDAVKPKKKAAKQEPVESPTATKVNKSEPKYTKVDKGDHPGLIYLGTFEVVAAPDIELPDFPAFDSAWPMLTQIEWLQTYRELAGR